VLDSTRYFDYAATTPVDPRVLAEMLPYFGADFGNSHSIHGYGRQAHAAVDRAREQVAAAIGAEDPSQIIFTSGATEACAIALNGVDEASVSPFEHSAVMAIAEEKNFHRYGWDGVLLGSDQDFSAVMRVNNVTGRILVHPDSATVRFTDATQAIGKMSFTVGNDDFVALSAHKIYGPKGIGALYARDPERVNPMLIGGGQEAGKRGGTLNVPGIVGMGLAAELAAAELEMRVVHALSLRQIVLDELTQTNEVLEIATGAGVPHILGLAFRGIQGETLVLEMDAQGFGLSAGPACSGGNGEIPSAITAEALPEGYARGAIRISFGALNTPDVARSLGQSLARTASNLRRLA
jgi:cysteine desulfurase